MNKNALYQQDIQQVAQLPLPWEQLRDQSFLIAGASGLIGKFLIDVLMYHNQHKQLNCHLFAIGRNLDKAKIRFADSWDTPYFTFIPADINEAQTLHLPQADYVLHAASNTHPVQYATDPVGTITTNLLGTYNLLNLAVKFHTKRVLFASSVEVYGENRGDVDLFKEDYCGYINCNTLRAGYPESKRCGEALCQAYIKRYGLDAVIPRIARVYGPTLLKDDTKALSQFIHNARDGKDIVLKSEGKQHFSYLHVADAVSGILTVMLKGKCGESYNIADEKSDITLRDLATLIAKQCGRAVIFDIPDASESAGYSPAMLARMDNAALLSLGWKAQYAIADGIAETMYMMKEGGSCLRV